MGLACNASFARAISAAIATVLACAGPSLAHAASLDAAAINDATLQAKPVRGINPAIVRTQIILDRLRFGPGIIDGHGGENVDRAIAAFQRRAGMQPTGKLDRETYDRIVEASSEPAVVEAKIEAGDVSGPFVKQIPAKLEQMAKLKRLGYRNAREALAEKHHVDETLLAALNPGAAFDKAGATLYVPDVRRDPVGAKMGRIEVLKDERRVRVLDETGVVLTEYPASIGSVDKPAPDGEFQVRAVAKNPTYTYDPKFAFKGVKATKPFEVPPGPNGPVGAVWIDLTAETYGIHGTADPSRIGKSFSHGCVRLANWDALDLAGMVAKGTPVDFIGSAGEPVSVAPAPDEKRKRRAAAR
jgi:lipoprotein-anchoring transpeptidase ErfK/SrfK